MKKFILLSILITSLFGCSATPGLTGHTPIALELKGHQIGQNLTSCPNPKGERKQSRILICLLPDDSLAGKSVKNAGIFALDGKVVLVQFSLSQLGGFSQTGVLQSLTEKFGPPARGYQSWIYLWRNQNAQLQVDEIKGEVSLLSSEGLSEMQREMGRINMSDL